VLIRKSGGEFGDQRWGNLVGREPGTVAIGPVVEFDEEFARRRLGRAASKHLGNRSFGERHF
jgi:hypothetical protein